MRSSHPPLDYCPSRCCSLSQVFLPFIILMIYCCPHFTSDWTQTLPPSSLDLNTYPPPPLPTTPTPLQHDRHRHLQHARLLLPGNMAGSVQNPKRNFPLAMLISIVSHHFETTSCPFCLCLLCPSQRCKARPVGASGSSATSPSPPNKSYPPTPPAPQFTRHLLPAGCRKLAGRLDQRQLRAGVLLLSGGQRRSHRPQPARHVGVGVFPRFFRFVVGQVGFLPPLFSNVLTLISRDDARLGPPALLGHGSLRRPVSTCARMQANGKTLLTQKM